MKLKGNFVSTPITVIALVIIVIVGVYLALTIKQANEIEEPITSTSTPTTSSDNTTPVTDETADSFSEVSTKEAWQTYTNDQYGFSFQYPVDWSVKLEESSPLPEIESRLTVEPTDSDLNNFDIIQSNIGAKNLMSQLNQGLSDKSYNYQITDTAFNNQKSEKLISNKNERVYLIIKNGQKQYIIAYLNNNSIHSQILATFKFTD